MRAISARFGFKAWLLAGVVALAPTLVSTGASAQSIGVAVGTQGAGLEAGIDITEMLGLRVAGNYFSMSRGVSGDDVDYDGDLRLMSIGIVGDVYLFESGFRLTGGGYLNRNKIDLTAVPTSNVEIGGTTYTPAQLGTLDGFVRYRSFAPYAGLGYTGNRGDSGLSFVFDAGVMFQGGSRVALTANGPANGIPGFAADLERERRDIKDDVDDFKYYPVVKVGLAYRF